MTDGAVFGTEAFEHREYVEHRNLGPDSTLTLLQECGQQLLTISHVTTFPSSCVFGVYVGRARQSVEGTKVPSLPTEVTSRC